jgi:hypothetical protein
MIKYLLCVCFTILVAVLFSSQAAMAQQPVEPVPTLSEWGMMGTAVVLGLTGAYRILRRKK